MRLTLIVSKRSSSFKGFLKALKFNKGDYLNTFTFKPEMLSLLDTINGMPFYGYRHDNGYLQCFIDDFDGEIGGKEYFIDTLNNGSNALYKAYSLLPSELIKADGTPEIEFDFGDAQIFIDTGVYPSAEKLQANAAASGSLIANTKALDEL